MFDAYKKSVIAHYRSLKDNRQLLSELENPSPGKLKRVCVKILVENPKKKDRDVLYSFFNPKNEYDSLEKSISSYDSDKLRPLINLMKGEIADSNNDDNFKLLAVLIGFEPRPYTLDADVSPISPSAEPEPPETSAKKDVIKKGGENAGGGHEGGDTLIYPKWKKSIVYSITTLAFIILVSTIFFPPKKHMIWRNDRYYASAQTALVGDTMLVALDQYRLEKFRKIMKIDTVTAYSIGKLWYLKTDNKLELFTTGGKHPIHTERQLKILTQEIYDRYLRKE